MSADPRPENDSPADQSDDAADHLSEELRIHEQAESFEQAWQSGETPSFDKYLQAEGVDRLGLLTELTRVDLEQRLRRGEAVRVETYLARYPELSGSFQTVVDLVVWEHRVRKLLGDPVASDEYRARFPEHAEALQARLDAPLPKPPPRALRLNCPHCYNPIEVLADAEEEILCPSCGSTFRVDNQQTGTWSKDKLPKLGKFALLTRLGFGAFGTVYKAYDTELKRTVALKLPRSGTIVDQEDEERFLREARSAAQLRHSGIVPIFEVGRSQHFLYIVSELVEGITLADALTAKRLSFQESAELISQVAEALDYSHKQGVVHRDLKPSNIMLTANGTPRLMDFGLAKRETGEVTMTVEGQVLGTPAYMSPEIAAGKAHQVDGRSDVYSLGVILYELLTHELPFRGNQRMLMHQVMHDEPRAPRSLNDRIPRDLETICLKAMAKEPERRYGKAKELAADLKLYLAGQPILARPVGRVERAWRWCKRQPVGAALLAALIAGTAGTTWQAVRATQAEHAISLALDDVTAENTRANKNEARAIELAKKESRLRERVQVQAARLLFEQGWSKYEQGESRYAALLIARSLLDLESLQSSPRDTGTPAMPEALSLGKSIRTHLLELALNLNSPRATFASDRAAFVVAFSPTGEELATASDNTTARLWHVTTREPRGNTLPHADLVTTLNFSPDGSKLATGSWNKRVQVWDVATAQPLRCAIQLTGPVSCVTFSPDGSKLATGSWDKSARVWDVATGDPLSNVMQHIGPVSCITFSSDGTKLFTGSFDHTAQLWDVATGVQLGDVLRHSEPVSSVGFERGGTILVTRSIPFTAQMYLMDGRPLGLSAVTGLYKVVFSPDRTKLVMVSENPLSQSVQHWDLATGKQLRESLQHKSHVTSLVFSPDSTKFATATFVQTVQLWDAFTGKQLGDELQPTGSVEFLIFSPDGSKLAIISGFSAQIWDLVTGKPLGGALQHAAAITSVAFSDDGTKLATASNDHTARFWEVATGEPYGQALEHGTRVNALAFSHDGTKLATCSGNGARLWQVATSKRLGEVLHHSSTVKFVAFSPDDVRLATRYNDHDSRLWDVATGKPIGDTFHDSSKLWSVTLSSDGTTLFSLSAVSDTKQIWNIPGDLVEPAEQVNLWIETLVGATISNAGVLRPLSSNEIQIGKDTLDKRGGPPRAYLDALNRREHDRAPASSSN